MRRLLIRPGAIGDCIVSLPALESLGSDYTEIWTASPNVSLIRFADRVRSIPATGLDLLEIRGEQAPAPLLEALASFDSIVSWYGTNRDEFRRLVRRLGFPFHFLPALPAGAVAHAVDFYLEQARGLGGCPVEATPRIPCRASGGGCVVLHPFSGSPPKNWPLERFRQLADRLAVRFPVEWCAGPEEELPGARRFGDLYQLGCWLAGARLYIGNDSGITHLAAAVGAPVIALFGPTDPATWAPRGRAVRVITTPVVGGPMTDIPVPPVFNAALRALA